VPEPPLEGPAAARGTRRGACKGAVPARTRARSRRQKRRPGDCPPIGRGRRNNRPPSNRQSPNLDARLPRRGVDLRDAGRSSRRHRADSRADEQPGVLQRFGLTRRRGRMGRNGADGCREISPRVANGLTGHPRVDDASGRPLPHNSHYGRTSRPNISCRKPAVPMNPWCGERPNCNAVLAATRRPTNTASPVSRLCPEAG
jgi:hypothetical protein